MINWRAKDCPIDAEDDVVVGETNVSGRLESLEVGRSEGEVRERELENRKGSAAAPSTGHVIGPRASQQRRHITKTVVDVTEMKVVNMVVRYGFS